MTSSYQSHVTETGVNIPRLALDGYNKQLIDSHYCADRVADGHIVDRLLRESKSCHTQHHHPTCDVVRGQSSDLDIPKREDSWRKGLITNGEKATNVGNRVGERAGAMQKLRLDAQIAAVSRNRAIFNRNMETLPDIGRTTPEVSFYTGALPKADEIEGRLKNPVIDVINRNAAKVRATAQVRDISHNFTKSAEGIMKEHQHATDAVMIEKNQRKNTKSSFMAVSDASINTTHRSS